MGLRDPEEIRMDGKHDTGDRDVVQEISSIAARNIPALEERGDLEARDSDGADFFETAVWSLKNALMEAYALGMEKGIEELQNNLKGSRCYGDMGLREGVDEFMNSSTDLENKKRGTDEKQVYCLCEEYEGDDGIREFQILATSSEKDGLRKLMEAKITADEYGMIAENGVDTHDADHFMTEFDCGFVEYYILDQKVLSRDDLERMVQPSLDSVIMNTDGSRATEEDNFIHDDKSFER